MRKKTPEEIARAELSTPLGFYNFAASYRAAADKLRVCKLRATHPYSPIMFLYYHAIELYLKAFLRAEGFKVGDLEKIGHKFDKLQETCADKGLKFDDDHKEVLAMMAIPGTWSATRYLQVGFARQPTLNALRKTCQRLDTSVSVALNVRGIHIRHLKSGVRVRD